MRDRSARDAGAGAVLQLRLGLWAALHLFLAREFHHVAKDLHAQTARANQNKSEHNNAS